MPTYNLKVNGTDYSIDVTPEEEAEEIGILYYLRDELHINGPKYGCGVNVCQACTCRIKLPENGSGGGQGNLAWQSMTTCTTTFKDIAEQLNPGQPIEIVTIEGLSPENSRFAAAVKQAWVGNDVAQCGFCQPGQIMRAVQVLEDTDGNPSDSDIDGIANVCRCGTYFRIREAIKEAGSSPA